MSPYSAASLNVRLVQRLLPLSPIQGQDIQRDCCASWVQRRAKPEAKSQNTHENHVPVMIRHGIRLGIDEASVSGSVQLQGEWGTVVQPRTLLLPLHALLPCSLPDFAA